MDTLETCDIAVNLVYKHILECWIKVYSVKTGNWRCVPDISFEHERSIVAALSIRLVFSGNVEFME